MLISGEEIKTPNDKIFKSLESFPSEVILNQAEEDLENAILNNNINTIKKVLKDHVEGFKESGK